VLKGLPLTYNKDLQEDKEALFDTVDTLSASLEVTREMMSGATFDRERMAEALEVGFLTATEVADYLVRRGIPFREAHGIAGQVVKYCEEQGIVFGKMSLEEWRSFSTEFGEDITECISAAGAVKAKRSPGGTAPDRVKEQIEHGKKLLES
jgi:argininosuccinate lyase